MLYLIRRHNISKYYTLPVYSPRSLPMYTAKVALQGQQGASEQTVLLHSASYRFPQFQQLGECSTCQSHVTMNQTQSTETLQALWNGLFKHGATHTYINKRRQVLLFTTEADNVFLWNSWIFFSPLEEKCFGMIQAAQHVLYQGQCSEYTGLFFLTRGNCKGFLIGWKWAHIDKCTRMPSETHNHTLE